MSLAGSARAPAHVPDQPLPSINALVAATPNVEIVLPPGVYTEHVVLDRSVSLLPRDGPGTVTISVTGGTALIVRADANLRDIVIVIASGDTGLPAVSVEAGSPVFEHCEIRGARIEATGDASPTLRHCTISGAVSVGLLARGRSRPHLRDCLFDDIAGDGIAAEETARALIHSTTVAGPAGVGFRIVGDAQADIVHSWVVDSAGPGLLVDDRAAVRLRSCRFVNAATDALRIDGSSALNDRRLPFDEPTPLDETMAAVYGLYDLHGVTLTDCAVTGAGAEGLVATGGETRLVQTEISGSGGSGVLAVGSARLEFEDSAVVGSTAMGLVARGDSHLHGDHLTIRECGGHGIVAAEDASVNLTASQCTDVALNAAMITGHASLRARETHLGHAETGHGVWAREHAALHLTDCEIRSCGRDGVRVDGHGDATLHDCRISGARNGVMLTTSHHPVLTRCTIEGMERVGATIGPEGIALLRACSVSGTGSHGIFADHGSAPYIDGCHIVDTTGNGIAAWAAAEPRVVATTIVSTGGHGVSFQSEAGGAFENCDIGGAAGSLAVHQEPGAHPEFVSCRLHEPGSAWVQHAQRL